MSFTFEERSGYSAFALFNALKLHFSSPSYDFFKYHGKTNVSQSTFMVRKDKYSFYKLSRKYSLDELRNFYISNLLEKDIKWVGDIIGPEGEETYKNWQKRTESLTYRFEQDIIHLFDNHSPSEILKVPDGQYPPLLTELITGDIMMETMCIMNDLMNFIPMWSKKISDDIIFPNWKLKIEKYTPFLNYDKQKFKNIMKESLHENC